MLQDMRTQKGLAAFSEIDIQNIKHSSGGRELQRQRNQQDINIHNDTVAAKIATQKKKLEMFDFDQVFFINKLNCLLNNLKS